MVTELGDRVRLVRVDEVKAVVDDARPLARPSPWPCRCRARGTPAASRRRRSRRGIPRASRRSASAMARPVLPVAVGPPMTTSGARAGARARRTPLPGPARCPSGEGPPQRVRSGVVDRDVAPARPAGSRRPGHVDELVLARPSDEVRDAVGRASRTRRATRPCRRRRRRRRGRASAAAPPCRPAPRSSGRARPGCARGRSPPGPRAGPPSRRRFSAAGTSSARWVAGVPGRSL